MTYALEAPPEIASADEIAHRWMEQSARRSRPSPVFRINGRFFSQRLTGVQRYAIEITRELDGLLAERGLVAQLVVPNAHCLRDRFRAIEPIIAKPLSGQAWEQITLSVRRGARLQDGGQLQQGIFNLLQAAPPARRQTSYATDDGLSKRRKGSRRSHRHRARLLHDHTERT